MQIKVKFFKTIGVPTEPEANAFYFVFNEDETVSMFVTDQDGGLTSPGNPEFVIAVMAASMALKAPLNSPALTGVPTAPTAEIGDEGENQIATIEYVKATRDELIAAAPGALDTLNEIAAALGDDANFAATMTTALAGKVPTSRTVNGHALSANVTVTKGDVGLGNVDNTSDANKPVSTAQQTALDLKAPLASPALTGNPTAPTQAAGNSTTRLATTAFVQAAIAALINSAPGALDTLNELAAALGNDANFASTVTTALVGKAPLASPALTGSPTAPTQALGDNTTKLATTEFVTRAGGRVNNIVVDAPLTINLSNYAAYAGATIILTDAGSITFNQAIPDIFLTIDNQTLDASLIESLTYPIVNLNNQTSVAMNGVVSIYVVSARGVMRLIGETV